MILPAWVEQYIGLPFKAHGRTREGVDCWGLVRMVMAEQFGLKLPDYTTGYETPNDRASVPFAIDCGLREGWHEIEAPAPGTLVVFKIYGLPMHCGVVVGPYHFLHVQQGVESAIERLDAKLWVRRVEGFYRYG